MPNAQLTSLVPSLSQQNTVVTREDSRVLRGSLCGLQYGNASLAEAERESGVTYQVRLTNGYRVRVHVFVVYDEAQEVTQQPATQHGAKAQKLYRWPAVSRAQCKKGCQVGSFCFKGHESMVCNGMHGDNLLPI